MKTLLNTAFFVAFAAITAWTITGPALAGWTCQTYGQQTQCWNSQTGQRYTCMKYGNQTQCW
jgi:hypothetical protein